MITVTLTPVRRTGILHQDWRDQAACIGADLALFFPEQGETAGEAKRICARCPVLAECLEDAVLSTDRYGVRGGLSERQRQDLTPGDVTAAAEHSREALGIPGYWEARTASVVARIASGEKYCSKCDETKPIGDFGPNRSAADGHAHYCRSCMRGYGAASKAVPQEAAA